MAKQEQNTASQHDYEIFLSDSNLSDYLRIIKQYKPSSKKENEEMLRRYYAGEESIREEIINRNLAFVVYTVMQLSKNLTADEKLEYIQCGSIGLMEAIDHYDAERGTFLSIASIYIKKEIFKFKYDQKDTIRRSREFLRVKRRRADILKEYSNTGNKELTRNELIKMLGTSENMLSLVEADEYLNPISMSFSPDDDDDSLTLEEITGQIDTGYAKLLNKASLQQLLECIKILCSPKDYFILFYRYIYPTMSLQQIGDLFSLTRERIRMLEKDALCTLQSCFDEEHEINKEIIAKVKNAIMGRTIKTTPIQPEDYALYFFLRDTLTNEEQIILQELLLSNFEIDETILATKLKKSQQTIRLMVQKIQNKMQKEKQTFKFAMFQKRLLREKGIRIFKMNYNDDISAYLDNREELYTYWKDQPIEEIMEYAKNANLPFDQALQDKIQRFLGIAPYQNTKSNKSKIERDVNYSLFGFATPSLSISKLYPVFKNNMDKFSKLQQNYLMTYVFHKKKAPKNSIGNTRETKYLLNKLFALSVKFQDYREDNFTKEKYLSIRSTCQSIMSEEEITLLDIYYGKDNHALSIAEVAASRNVDRRKVEKDFYRSKEKAISIYLGTNIERWDKTIYVKYLDEVFKNDSDHYKMAAMFLKEDKSYEEIAKYYNRPRRKVAEIIKYVHAAIDLYRFGITSEKFTYKDDLLLQTLENSDFDEEKKETLRIYIKLRSVSETEKRTNQSKTYIQYASKKLRMLASKSLIANTSISKEEIENAIQEHPATNILSEREKLILSLYMGIRNAYNPEGKRKHPIDIAKQTKIRNSNIKNVIEQAIHHVKAHKIGILKTPIDFIDRQKLGALLMDENIPLKDEDKKLLIRAYGLYTEQFFPINVLAKKYKSTKNVILQRIYKSYVVIQKYLAGEIKKKISYEKDILPYEKFFISEDREILRMIYQEHKTLTEVSAAVQLSKHQLRKILNKIELHLNDLRDHTVTGMDFDFFWSNVDNKDLPYDKDVLLAVDICYLYYEKRLSKADILRLHYPNLNDHLISTIISEFTIAMIKLQHGIKKEKRYSTDQVIDYYQRKESEMNVAKLTTYRKYLRRCKKNGPYTNTAPNREITFDLIKDNNDHYFTLENATPEEAQEILKTHYHTLPQNVISSLEGLFGVTHYNLLSKEDTDEVIEFLGRLQLEKEKDHTLTLTLT